jgi:sec-independent protein translocase protein TatB
MFEIGWSELLLVAVVAIVVIGPKDLPRALRVLGQWTGRVKRMAREFQNQFNEAIREAELDSVQRDIEEIGKIDPVADIREAATQAGADIQKDLQQAGEPPKPPELPAPPAIADSDADVAKPVEAALTPSKPAPAESKP